MSKLDGHRRLMLTMPALAFAAAGSDTVLLGKLGVASVPSAAGLSPELVVLGLIGCFLVALAALVGAGWLILRQVPAGRRGPA